MFCCKITGNTMQLNRLHITMELFKQKQKSLKNTSICTSTIISARGFKTTQESTRQTTHNGLQATARGVGDRANGKLY